MRVHGGGALMMAGMLALSADAPATTGVEALGAPAGVRIGYYSRDVPGARSLAVGSRGTVFVGTLREGVVYALVDADGDGRAERRLVVADGLFGPNGVAFHDGDLYIAEVNRILRLPGIEQRLDRPPPPEVVYDRLPRRLHHGWRYIRFGPDGHLYVTIGAPCNVCEPPPPFATVSRLDRDFHTLETWARGVRNSVGLAWHPRTGALWFTDNGRDWLGDDRPPEEINIASAAGLHFGFPYVHGRAIRDPEFGDGHDPGEFEPPALELPAHVAPLGIAFCDRCALPPQWQGRAFVAEHGSWNRSRKAGYQVIAVDIDDAGRPVGWRPFITGWLEREASWGRPVDIAFGADGSMLVSDDQHGAVYRVTRSAAAAQGAQP